VTVGAPTAATTEEALLRVQPREGLTSSNQIRKQNMNNVPNPTDPHQAPVDCRGFRIKERTDVKNPRQVQYIAKGRRTEKMLVSVVYRPATRTLYYEEFEGGTDLDYDRVTSYLKELVKGTFGGAPADSLPWEPLQNSTGCLVTALGYVLGDPLDELQVQLAREALELEDRFQALTASLAGEVHA
jgi:hypothetical protein